MGKNGKRDMKYANWQTRIEFLYLETLIIIFILENIINLNSLTVK